MKHNTYKRRTLMAAAAILMAAPLVPSAMAQGPGGPRGGRGNRLDFLAGYLALTDAQKTQAQSIFDAASTASETARGQSEAARTALEAAVKANQSDAEIDRLAAAIGVIHGQVTAIQAKAQAKFYALLTAEQKTKYDALHDRAGDGPRGPRGRGPGGE
ncbi:MAG: Spy/CpxP family protein refolding chaperone [Bryobacteraceae bacterium]